MSKKDEKPTLDLEALRRLGFMKRCECMPRRGDHDYGLGGPPCPDCYGGDVIDWSATLAALERAEEVADQGCEFCENAVDDLGEERDGGREPHAHWWACGVCWNKSAVETSTAIGHFSDLLDRALERIPELERQVANLEADLHSQDADYWRERAKRVDAEARLDPGRKSCPIHGALAAAPGVEAAMDKQQRSAGAFLRDAMSGVRLDVYRIRTQTWANGSWPQKLSGVMARQRGRHDYDVGRPDRVDKLAFEVAVQDVDDLLTLLAAALHEEWAGVLTATLAKPGKLPPEDYTADAELFGDGPAAPAIGSLECPRCGSPKPELHPAIQADGGEVSPCSHPFHASTPEGARALAKLPSGILAAAPAEEGGGG